MATNRLETDKQAPSPHRRARRLRAMQSDAERLLWWHLRARQLRGVKFRRQQPIGRFTVDFCSLDPKLVIEVDGGQHAAQVVTDAQRTAFLERSGYRLVRFWNHDVLQRTEAVLERIVEAVEAARAARVKSEGEKRASDPLA